MHKCEKQIHTTGCGGKLNYNVNNIGLVSVFQYWIQNSPDLDKNSPPDISHSHEKKKTCPGKASQ